MANRGIAQRTLGYVSYTGSGGVGGVGDCTRPTSTLGNPRETPGPRIDRIPWTRPPWWRRQYRELKKVFLSAPSRCSIDLFGPVANGRYSQVRDRFYFQTSVSSTSLAQMWLSFCRTGVCPGPRHSIYNQNADPCAGFNANARRRSAGPRDAVRSSSKARATGCSSSKAGAAGCAATRRGRIP